MFFMIEIDNAKKKKIYESGLDIAEVVSKLKEKKTIEKTREISIVLLFIFL